MARRLRAGFIYIFVVLSIYLVFKQLLLGRYADNENTIYEEEELRFSGAPQSNSGGSDFALFTRAPQSAGVNCRGLFEGESQALQHAVDYMKTHPKIVVKDNAYVNMTKNCQLFKERRGYVTQPPSAEEADFPIAYSLLMYKEVEQAERLLRAIYRPQNSYCIHIDKDAPHEVQSAIAAIVKCFDNVFIASKLERIIYAGFSRLQADVNCMADQLRNSARWKYYINLASQAFPLKTNAEIVKILKTYNGANDIEGLPAITSRYVYHYNYSIPNKGKPVLKSSGVRKAKPPHGITIVKGSAYGVFSRAFVEFIINDKRAVDLLEWSKDTYSPDEHYWSTLHHLQHNSFLNTPGGYSGRYKLKGHYKGLQ